MLATAVHHVIAATDHFGQVTFGGLAVPGATVTASQGETQVVATTDLQGIYRMPGLADGTWTIKVEMLGFAPVSREITVAAGMMPVTWELMLLPLPELSKLAPAPATAPASTASSNGDGSPASAANGATRPGTGQPGTAAGNTTNGFQRAGVTAAAPRPGAAAATAAAPPEPPADPAGAADGLLVNGSVNNGAASPFAQPAAFGNNRRRGASLYTYALGMVNGNSIFDAAPASFSSQRTSKPDYNNVHVLGTFQGPVRIPHLLVNRAPTVFVGFQRTDDTNANTVLGVVPTALQRAGDFSNTFNAAGQRVTVIDPITGQPFPGGVIPAGRISPQAAALLRYYPQPNTDGTDGSNFQAPVLSDTTQNSVQTRVTQPINTRNSLFGTLSYQRTDIDSTSLFGFEDATANSALDANVTWAHRFNQFVTLRPRYQYTQTTNRTTPYFAGRTNVLGEAGIAGGDQSPANWGPPSLAFASGIERLFDAVPASTRSRTHVGAVEAFWAVRRHNLTIGGDVRHNGIAIRSQQDPRGGFSFTGAATGSDFADFLLGIPTTSAIASGNPDKDFGAVSYDAYITDDLRLSPSFTLNAGVRWEYEAPLTEALGRLVNLDVASGFSAVAPVLASDPVGALTGTRYADSLLRADRLGIQPRLAIAWRPVPGSSLIVRAGYGVYRNTNVYQPIATLLAQQPPLSNTFSIQNNLASPFTLANGLVASGTAGRNTFAVDPDFKVGYAQNWQASVQRDLPYSLTVMASYLGAKGSHLMQEILPNSYAPGAVNPCPACPLGFVYLTSNGSSLRNAAQLQVRRRLRNGLTAQMQYTLSKSTDDAAAFNNVGFGTTSLAQNWLDLDAERAPSAFDQRHLVTAQVQYTTGVGLGGGGLMNGVRGTLLKGWTLQSQLTTGSGLPLTPIVLSPIPGTGMTGVRAALTGASTDAPDGYYLNPAAYAIPLPGQWGSAGRNSMRGPAQFALSAGVMRTFTLNNRFNLDWRIDATNALNSVTYASVNTLVGSPQFGLPTRANTMRKVQSTLRLRF